jgi:RHS repeat-associated protein
LDGQLTDISTRDANNHISDHASDVFGRLSKVVEWSGNGGSGGNYSAVGTTYYNYNILDQLTTTTDAQSHQTTISYDSLGRKTSMTDPDMGHWTYTYDPNGNLLSQVDAKSQTINFHYDALDRLISKNYPDSSQSTYSYDESASSNGKGLLTSIASVGTSTRYQYDARGRKTSESVNLGAPFGTQSVNWNYDSADRVTSIGYPGEGEVVSYTYDGGWRQNSACSNLGWCYVSSASYTALNQPVQQQYGNSTQGNWSYTGPMQRLYEQWIKNVSSAFIYDRSYGYDNVGNVTSQSNNLHNAIQLFNYDAQNRVTHTNPDPSHNLTDGYTQDYSYDNVGNLTSKAGVSYSYSNGHPHQVSSVGGSSYGYDGNGNVTSGGGRTLTWNYDNLPGSVTVTASGVSESYSYDANGARYKRSSGGKTTVFVEGDLWEEDQAGGFQTHIMFNGGVVAQRSLNDDGTRSTIWLHSDYLGSASLSTDIGGNLASQQEYDVWGAPRTAFGSGSISQTDVNYTGQIKDASTGLMYYNSRYYDPTLGRFLSADSIVPGMASGAGGGAATLGQDSNSELRPLTVDFHEVGFAATLGDENRFTQQKGFTFQLSDQDRQKAKDAMGPANPQALNRYSYTLNNPLRYTDPTGHSVYMSQTEAGSYAALLHKTARVLKDIATMVWIGGSIIALASALLDDLLDLGLSPFAAGGIVEGITLLAAGYIYMLGVNMDSFGDLVDAAIDPTGNNTDGVVIQAGCQGLRFQCSIAVIERGTGVERTMEPGGGLTTMWWWKGFFEANDGQSKLFEPGKSCTRKGGNAGPGQSGNYYDNSHTC